VCVCVFVIRSLAVRNMCVLLLLDTFICMLEAHCHGLLELRGDKWHSLFLHAMPHRLLRKSSAAVRARHTSSALSPCKVGLILRERKA
jgi:hypothetical protein